MTSARLSAPPPVPDAAIQSQIDSLWRGGMAFPHRERAAHFLSHVNCCRLRGYWQPFEDRTTGGERPAFGARTTFDAVIKRYEFDRELRTLLLDAFSHIEVSIRTGWTRHLAEAEGGGPAAHLNAELFSGQYYANLTGLHRAYARHGNRADRHNFADCPIWVIVEAMSFGQLSRWYGDTGLPVRRLVAGGYGMDERILQAVLRHLAPIRNICAHHDRLWDREFITRMPVPRRLGGFRNPRQLFNRVDNGRLYNTLVMVAYLTGVIRRDADWAERLKALMNRYPRIPQDRMGFPHDWQRLDIWQAGPWV